MRAQLLPTLLALTVACVSSDVFASQADIDAEINRYITSIKGTDYPEQRQLMEKLEWAGHSSAALYDVIADALSSRKDSKDSVEQKQAAWYAKSLATSGSENYRALLEDVAANAKGKSVRKYATIGLDRLEQYRAWNAVITRGLIEAANGRLEQTRIANMLQADEFDLLRIGAKRVYHEYSKDAELVKATQLRLSAEWNQVDAKNGHHIDAVAWLIKALGQARDASSKALLLEIKENSKIKKIRNYAKNIGKKLA